MTQVEHAPPVELENTNPVQAARIAVQVMNLMQMLLVALRVQRMSIFSIPQENVQHALQGRISAILDNAYHAQ